MKPRILIPITVQFSVRYLVRTGLLNLIREYARPVIVLGWKDHVLSRELEMLGIDVYQLPSKQIGVQYSRLLAQLTQWHLLRINTPTTAIDRRRTQKMMPLTFLKLRKNLRDALYYLIMQFPPYVNYLLARQKLMIWQDTNLCEYLDLVKQIMPDVVFCLTPYFIEEEFLLRAAQELEIPLCTAILSFDNLTTRPYIPVRFEKYLLWNKYNEAELHRIYPESASKSVEIVGAPQFDFYYDASYVWREEAWRSELGLPPSRPVILFGSASAIIAPQEEQWLLDIDRAIDQDKIINRPIVLLRRHPNEPAERWDWLRGRTKNVFFDEPWQGGSDVMGKTNVTRRDIEKLASTLYHSAVHINASSTMTVDGSIFDRPQIGPAYDNRKKYHRVAYEIYLREHYLPITKSGGLEIVRSRNELIQAVNNAFQYPGRLSENRKTLVREICTYSDGLCTDRVNQALKAFVENINNGNAVLP